MNMNKAQFAGVWRKYTRLFVVNFTVVTLSSFLVNSLSALESEVTELVNSISEQSPLYRDVEVKYVFRTEYATPTEADPAKAIRAIEMTYHAVWQGARYHCVIDAQSVKVNTTSTTLRSILAFDGTTTRSNVQNQVGNVNDARVPGYPFQPPHLIGMFWFGELSIPDILLLPQPARHYLPPFKDVESVKATHVGTGNVGDVACQRMRIQLVGLEGVLLATYEFWIAPTRNYLVARTEKYAGPQGDKRISRHEVVEWKEFESGIWTPKQVAGES